MVLSVNALARLDAIRGAIFSREARKIDRCSYLIRRLGRRSPSPLLFAVSASFHVAPLPMLTLTRIDEIDIAIRCAAFSNLHAVNVDKQMLHGDCTGMERDFGRQHVGPRVAREAL
jgi:hypothetical protein